LCTPEKKVGLMDQGNDFTSITLDNSGRKWEKKGPQKTGREQAKGTTPVARNVVSKEYKKRG